MVELIVVAFGVAVLAGLFCPSVAESGRRKRVGNDEVLHSTYQDWGVDDPWQGYPGNRFPEPQEPPEPSYGVIRIQAW